MIIKSSKTATILASFMAISVAMTSAGCSDEENAEKQSSVLDDAEYEDNEAYDDQILRDDDGNEYTLHRNSDGSETARYNDGREVTFRRDSDGGMSFLSGTAGLLAGMAAGYYLFHGFSTPRGTYNPNTNRYTVSEPLKRMTNAQRRQALNTYVPTQKDIKPNSTATSTKANTNKAVSSTKTDNKATTSSSQSNTNNSNVSNSKSNTSKSSVSNSTAKSGFGKSGARSGTS